MSTHSTLNAPAIAFAGPLDALNREARASLMLRAASSSNSPSGALIRDRTKDIIEQVRSRGDNALFEFARQFDGAALTQLEVPRARWQAALSSLDNELRAALEHAANNIRTVHAAMMPTPVSVSPEPGVVIERVPQPLARVGVYAPGGRAAYPSSLLMGAVPARVAGVGEVIVCTPPDANGEPSPLVLAAALLAGVDRVFAVGGAGAIAAMALGTTSIPRVDRIVGPGNAYVAEAKLQLVNAVAIDSPAGPSELLVIAGRGSSASRIAHEMVAQAEHDPGAAVVTLLFGDDAAERSGSVQHALAELLISTPRNSIVREALSNRGALLTCKSVNEAMEFANEWAAEHLLLLYSADDARLVRNSLRNTGTVFTGDGASVAFGDYITGANHVLPTGGLARAYSGLSALDFVRWTSWQSISARAAQQLVRDTALLARAEGLEAHAHAAEATVRVIAQTESQQ